MSAPVEQSRTVDIAAVHSEDVERSWLYRARSEGERKQYWRWFRSKIGECCTPGRQRWLAGEWDAVQKRLCELFLKDDRWGIQFVRFALSVPGKSWSPQSMYRYLSFWAGATAFMERVLGRRYLECGESE